MRQVATTLALLAASGWITNASAQVKGDAAKAEALVSSVCQVCHGMDGNGPIAQFPRLAGQIPEYLVKQLMDFKNGKRQNDVMTPNAANLSNEDIANLAVYFAAQKATPAGSTETGLLAAGKKLFEEGNPATGIPSCSGCHGKTGTGSEMYPRISAQHAEYTVDELKKFATGKRKNDRRLMQTVATRLTDDEAKAVAQYLATLP